MPTTPKQKKKERNRLESVTFSVYENTPHLPNDIPLFSVQAIFTDLNMKRLKDLPTMKVFYELKPKTL